MPHLPQGKATLCAVSSQYPHIIAALEKEGIEVLSVAKNNNLPVPVASHSDMNMYHFGNDKVLICKEQEDLINRLSNLGFKMEILKAPLGNNYPDDVKLNLVQLGKYLFGKIDVAADEIFNFAQENTLKSININQGYAKCSTAIVNEHAVITSDTGIAQKLKCENIDVLLIGKGEILLEGYDTGFIGGSCFKIDRNTIVFTGDISKHSDYQQIKDFTNNHGVSIEILSSDILIDVGSIIPLKEKII